MNGVKEVKIKQNIWYDPILIVVFQFFFQFHITNFSVVDEIEARNDNTIGVTKDKMEDVHIDQDPEIAAESAIGIVEVTKDKMQDVHIDLDPEIAAENAIINIIENDDVAVGHPVTTKKIAVKTTF